MKDKRYKSIKLLIDNGDIKAFSDIFDHVPKTALADDLGIHFSRMNRMLTNVGLIRIEDVFLFAGYFEVDPFTIFTLVATQRGTKKTPANKKR